VAIERARAEAVEAVRRATPGANGAVSSSDEAETAAMKDEIARLRSELDDTASRLRDAYAQIDAMNGHTSPNGETSADELRELRREVQQLRRDQLETVARMHEAERKGQALEAELNTAQEAHAAALASGNGKVADEGEPPVGEGEQAARSLRARLTESAAQKKGKGGKFGFGP
jgi:predicted  nucleic acid-binding Zn-ribbon protein